MKDIDFGKEFRDLVEELKLMPENQNLEKIKAFNLSLQIFKGNYRELMNLIKVHNTPELSDNLLGVDNEQKLNAFQAEITRLLHNYIASAFSLVDHTRVHYRELYEEENIFPEYQSEINKRFVKNPLSIFVKDLRQFIQHFQMPRLTSKFKYSQGDPDLSISINMTIEDLNRFSGWKSKSKEYLSNHKEDINLTKVVNDYQEHIISFYDWFTGKQSEIHQSDVKEINEHKQKIRNSFMGRFLLQVMNKTMTIENLEIELRQFYGSNFKSIQAIKAPKERANKIIAKLKNEKYFNPEIEKLIRNLYNK